MEIIDEMVMSDIGEPYFVFERVVSAEGRVVALLTGFVTCVGPGRLRAGMAFAGGFVQLAEGQVIATDDGGFDAHLLADVWSHPDLAPVDATEMWIGCHEDELTLSLEVLLASGAYRRITSVLTRMPDIIGFRARGKNQRRAASSQSASPLAWRATRWFG